MLKTEKPKESKTSPDFEPTALTEDELDKVSGGPTAVEYRNNNYQTGAHGAGGGGGAG